jgi:hypothetical protein
MNLTQVFLQPAFNASGIRRIKSPHKKYCWRGRCQRAWDEKEDRMIISGFSEMYFLQNPTFKLPIIMSIIGAKVNITH